MVDGELIQALLLGIGLSAACGFRVFVPLLGVSIAALNGVLPLADGFAWLGTWPACWALGVATLLEVGAYSIPLLDHLLDTLSTPAAIIAGTLLTASLLGDASPLLKWSLAVIAGGGAAGIVQAGSVALRGGSLALTGGAGNLLVALLEFAGAVVTTILSLLAPLLVVTLLVIAGIMLIRAILRRIGPASPPS